MRLACKLGLHGEAEVPSEHPDYETDIVCPNCGANRERYKPKSVTHIFDIYVNEGNPDSPKVIRGVEYTDHPYKTFFGYLKCLSRDEVANSWAKIGVTVKERKISPCAIVYIDYIGTRRFVRED